MNMADSSANTDTVRVISILPSWVTFSPFFFSFFFFTFSILCYALVTRDLHGFLDRSRDGQIDKKWYGEINGGNGGKEERSRNTCTFDRDPN